MPTLKDLRAAAGLSQNELANASGVSIEAIKKIEAGKVERPHPATLRLLAAVLGQVPVVMNGSRNGPVFDPGMFDNARRNHGACLVVVPDEQRGVPDGFVPLRQTTLSGSIVGPLARLRLVQVFSYAKTECDRVLEAPVSLSVARRRGGDGRPRAVRRRGGRDKFGRAEWGRERVRGRARGRPPGGAGHAGVSRRVHVAARRVAAGSGRHRGDGLRPGCRGQRAGLAIASAADDRPTLQSARRERLVGQPRATPAGVARPTASFQPRHEHPARRAHRERIALDRSLARG